MNYGALLLRGLLFLLPLGFLGSLGVLQVNAANQTYRIRVTNVSGVTEQSFTVEGGDGTSPGTAFYSGPNPGLLAGNSSAYSSVNVVPPGTAVYARTKPNGGAFGSWFSIGSVSGSGGAANDFTVQWANSATPGGGSNYYWVTWCMTNRFATYIYPDPTMYFCAGGSQKVDLELKPLAPGAYRCITITNDTCFSVIWGDPLYASDEPLHNVFPGTNIVFTPLPGDSTDGGNNTPGPIAGNPNNQAGGGAAQGGTNAPNQLDINRAADGTILAIAAAAERIARALASNTTSITNALGGLGGGGGGGFGTNDSEQLKRIQTNTLNDAAFNLQQLALATNQNIAASDYNWQTMVLGTNAGATASNHLAGINFNAMDYNSVTGYTGGLVNNLKGAGVPAGFGMIQIDFDTLGAGVSLLSEPVIDIATVLDGSGLNPYFGSGWRTWFRLVLVWLMFLGVVCWYSRELRQLFAELCATSQIMVNAQAAGAASLIPGSNAAIRITLVYIAVSVVAFLPALVVTLISSGMALVAVHAGGPGTVSAAMGVLSGLSAAPAAIAALFTMFNSWFPLVEGLIFLLNAVVARMLIDVAGSFVNFFFKIMGV